MTWTSAMLVIITQLFVIQPIIITLVIETHQASYGQIHIVD